jgi:invasion protein IalB
MRYILFTLAIFLPALAMADSPAALGPSGGKFGDWTAASYGTGSVKVCYAFTDAQSSKPNWKSRGKVMLTVTQRAGIRDEVTLAAGYTYLKDAKVQLSVGSKSFDFYTEGGNAFTSSGAGAVAAFINGNAATATSTGPHGHPVKDQFSLTGFSGAYKAISTACK